MSILIFKTPYAIFCGGHWLPCTLALSKTGLLLVKLTGFCLMERKKKTTFY
jgi:hypothetical protein